MDPSSLGDLPTLEETIALVQDVISNGGNSATTSLTSPDGSYMSSHTPPHVNCDPFSPSMSQPSPFLSPANSQVSGPSMPSPNGVPTPDPSPLGRRDVDQARVNISWQGVTKAVPNQMHNQQPMQQQNAMSPPNCSPYGPCSPNYPINQPNGNVMSSKSAYLASVKKRERDYQSCVGNPSPPGYQRMQHPYNPSPPHTNVNNYNWNSGSYRPLTHMQNSNNYTGMIQNNDPTWGQPDQAVPPFEDTVPNLDYARTNILSPPYQDDSMTGGYSGYSNNHIPVTTIPSTKLGGW